MSPGTMEEQSRALIIPTRFAASRPRDPVAELSRLAEIFYRGSDALADLYRRMCDLIRTEGLTDEEARAALMHHLAPSRVSEILRICRAPSLIYNKYITGIWGFKAAVSHARLYQITPSDELRRRKMRRAAERLVLTVGDAGEKILVRGRVVEVGPKVSEQAQSTTTSPECQTPQRPHS